MFHIATALNYKSLYTMTNFFGKTLNIFFKSLNKEIFPK